MRTHFRRTSFVLLSLVLGIVGFALSAPGAIKIPSRSAANTLYLAPNGNDAGQCSQAAPCKTFARAYTVANSGDLVEVTEGTYPAQLFAGGAFGSQGGGTKTITFHGQPGNIVRQLHSDSPNITYDGLNVDCGGVKTTGACYEDGGAGTTFKNGAIGNVADEKGVYGGAHAVFDNVRFHDVVMTTAGANAGVHNECLYAIDAEGMVLRNSAFTNCSVMDVFFTSCTWCPSPHYQHVTVEGNTFDDSRFPNSVCCHYYDFTVGITGGSAPYQDDGWTIRNNKFPANSDVSIENHTFTNSTICGNTGKAPAAWLTACAAPPPPPATTATTATTTTPPPPPAYHPACEPTCDEQIAQLNSDKAALQQKLDAIQAWHDQYPG